MIKQPKILRTAQTYKIFHQMSKKRREESRKLVRSPVISFALGLYVYYLPRLQLTRAQIKLYNISQVSHAQPHLFLL